MNNLFPGENQLASATAISDALTLEAVRNESPDQGYGHRRWRRKTGDGQAGYPWV